jgi:maltose alpha-D-glucosyltransferase/alpha-amylase
MSQNRNDRLLWYKDAIIYELHIKAFYDSNGDGIGDFGGLLQKLDYLQELGVTAIWLLPFYPSPLKDDGYDIADYYNINTSYGTLEQLQKFIEEAHRRNLKVITELVVNHTSDQHPWFQRARKAPRDSAERNFYVWTDDPNQYKDVRIIFQDYEASNWSWDPVAQQYYWHRFFHHQPDLNYDNPQVQEEIIKVLDYWCIMGVDGFRLDAVPYLYEREGTNGENLPETHAYLKKLRRHIDEFYPGTCFLAEANMWPEDSASYFGNGDECHMNYHFPVMPRMFMALQREDRYPITDIFDQTPEIPENCQWAMFLRNHDELTLEMVTDEERDYMYRVYAKDPKAKINLGIRHRLAPLMDNDRRKIELMNSLLFSLPGTPVIYYGDEIGMGDNFYLGDRDGVRTPMQWSPDRNAGFSNTNPHKLYLPVIIDPQYHYESVNVETQRANTSSLFWFMKRIINMRKKYKAFSRGKMEFIHVDNPKILAFTRTYQDETLLILVNLSKYAQPAEVDLKNFKGYVPVEVFSKNPFPLIKDDEAYFFTLGAHSYQWFELRKVHTTIEETQVSELSVTYWEELLTAENKDILQTEILPAYLQKVKWFLGKQRLVYNVSITQHTSINDANAILLLLEISYESGLSEWYQLPVTWVAETDIKEISDEFSDAIIARLKIGEQEGFLCDAYYTSQLQTHLVRSLSENKEERGLKFSNTDNLQKFIAENEIKPRIHVADRINTSITYNNQYFLKLFRKVDVGIHPELEVTRFLTTDENFEHTPALVGSIEWQNNNSFILLGMMDAMVENHGDGKSFMLERINNYIERILARDMAELLSYQCKGSLANPVAFTDLPENVKSFLGGSAADIITLIGTRIGEMHLALTQGTDAAFRPEEFSLHYQRSLYSSMQSIVREAFQSLEKNYAKLSTSLQQEADGIRGKKEQILLLLKRVYAKKLDVLKTRIHGFYTLEKVLLTGKDVAIHGFSGNPLRPYSERRLKRSPLRDVSSMVESIYHIAYEGFFTTSQLQKNQVNSLLHFAQFWAYHMSQFFLHAYLEVVRDSAVIPKEKEDLQMLLETFLLENALLYLNYEVNYRREYSIVPLKIIQSILSNETIAKQLV